MVVILIWRNKWGIWGLEGWEEIILTWGEEIDWVNEVEEIEDRFKKLAREIESEMFLYSSAFIFLFFYFFNDYFSNDNKMFKCSGY